MGVSNYYFKSIVIRIALSSCEIVSGVRFEINFASAVLLSAGMLACLCVLSAYAHGRIV